MSDLLNIVCQNHEDWVNMVKSMGANGSSEDIVQDAYLRIHKYAKPEKIAPNGKVNRAFMFVVLRNVYRNHCTEKAKVKMVSLSDTFELRHTDRLESKQAQHRFDQKLIEAQKDWHWYDKMLFNYYKDSGLSLRQIEAETNISLTSLWNTIRNCKKRLKKELGEDYQDLINEDYELI